MATATGQDDKIDEKDKTEDDKSAGKSGKIEADLTEADKIEKKAEPKQNQSSMRSGVRFVQKMKLKNLNNMLGGEAAPLG